MAETNPMLLKMLASMTGMSPEQMQNMAQNIGGGINGIVQGISRIEKNTQLLIEAENERRASEGRPRIEFARSDGNGSHAGAGDNSNRVN